MNVYDVLVLDQTTYTFNYVIACSVLVSKLYCDNIEYHIKNKSVRTNILSFKLCIELEVSLDTFNPI